MTGLLTGRYQLKHPGPQAVSALTPPLDRPWRRPGAFRYALGRLRGIARPPVFVTEAPGSTPMIALSSPSTLTERAA